MRRRVLLAVLLCGFAVVAKGDIAEAKCPSEAALRDSNDPRLRKELSVCVESALAAWSQNKSDTNAKAVEERQTLALDDLGRLIARRTALVKLEDDANLDEETFNSLQDVRASVRALERIARFKDDKPALVANALVDAKAKTAKTTAQADAVEICRDTDAYLVPDDAKAIANCIDVLREDRRGTRNARGRQNATLQVQTADLPGGCAQDASMPGEKASDPCAQPALGPKAVRRQLAKYEEAGRRLAAVTSENLSAAREARGKAESIEGRAKEDAKVKAASDTLDILRPRVIVPMEDARTEFADYEQWYSKFSTGFEYITVSDAFSKGFMRVGLNLGFQYPRLSIPENDERNWHFYGVYSMFSMALTNTGEASAATVTPAPPFLGASRGVAGQDEDNGEEENPPTTMDKPNVIRRALEFESQFFVPVWRNDYQNLNPRLRTRIGPLLVFGARKADDDTFAHHRAYIGIRNARSPDTFWDVMYGRTGGLRSRRVEFRGQYQLQRFFPGNARLMLGAVGNFGSNRRRHGTCDETDPGCRRDEPDSIRFYMNYELPGEAILKLLGMGSEKPKN